MRHPLAACFEFEAQGGLPRVRLGSRADHRHTVTTRLLHPGNRTFPTATRWVSNVPRTTVTTRRVHRLPQRQLDAYDSGKSGKDCGVRPPKRQCLSIRLPSAFEIACCEREGRMNPRRLYRIVLGLCFVLLFGVAVAQQSKQDPVYFPAPGTPGWKVTAKETLGAYSFSVGVRQPGGGVEPHRHSREDESFYVLEGQFEFRIGERGERVILADPGSFVFAPRGIPHAFKNVGTTPGKFLVVVSPAGLEKFFDERTALGKEIPTTDPSYAARSKALNEKYGLEYSSDWSFPPAN